MLKESASMVAYLTAAGIICLPAISIMVLASMLIALLYASYSISTRDSSSAFVNTLNASNIRTDASVVRAGIASTMDLMFGRPLISASSTHASA